MEPTTAAGQQGERSSFTVGMHGTPVTLRKASEAQRRPARNSVWRLLTASMGGTPQRAKSSGASRAGSKRVLISCAPDKASGRGQ